MPTEIGPEIQRALDEHRGSPVTVVDPRTNEAYVLFPARVYDRLKAVLDDGPLSEAERTGLLRDAGMRAGWDDAEMDIQK